VFQGCHPRISVYWLRSRMHVLSNKKPGTLLHPHAAQILASLGRPFVPPLSSPLVQVQSVPLNYLQLGETGIHDSLDLVPDKQSMCRTLQYNTCITEKQELLAHITSPMPGVRNNSGWGHDCRLPMPMQNTLRHTEQSKQSPRWFQAFLLGICGAAGGVSFHSPPPAARQAAITK
jgi:hypothetical protein